MLYVLTERRLLRYDPEDLDPAGRDRTPGGLRVLGRRFRAGRRGDRLAGELHDDILLIGRNGEIARTFHDAVYAVSDDSLQEPFVAVDRAGFIYVGDEGTHRIYKFDPQGRFISRFGFSADPADPSHENIHGLAIDSQGHLWVAGWSSVNVFASDGRFLEHFSDRHAHDLVIDDHDALYAAEWTRVAKYAAVASGFQEAAPAPPKASKPGVMPEPPRKDSGLVHFKPAGTKPMEKATLVAVGPEGFVYAGDPGAGRVLRFKPSGELASQFPLQDPGAPGPAWPSTAAAPSTLPPAIGSSATRGAPAGCSARSGIRTAPAFSTSPRVPNPG